MVFCLVIIKNINLVFYPINKAGSIYQIPKEVTHANFAFINNRCLKTLVINNSTNTTYSSMAENSNIETIIIPDKIKFIGEQSFEKCKKLKKVVIGKDVTKICDEAFYDCTSLETIVLPNKLERIDRWAFKNCKALKKLSIPSSVHYIDPLAFEGCKPSIRREAYLKKQKNGSYIAKANVTANGKKKEYKAKNITKITTSDKKITLKKVSKRKLKQPFTFPVRKKESLITIF